MSVGFHSLFSFCCCISNFKPLPIFFSVNLKFQLLPPIIVLASQIHFPIWSCWMLPSCCAVISLSFQESKGTLVSDLVMALIWFEVFLSNYRHSSDVHWHILEEGQYQYNWKNERNVASTCQKRWARLDGNIRWTLKLETVILDTRLLLTLSVKSAEYTLIWGIQTPTLEKNPDVLE